MRHVSRVGWTLTALGVIGIVGALVAGADSTARSIAALAFGLGASIAAIAEATIVLTKRKRAPGA
ncbi:hypothetical protein [Streptosporangium saharense]|uniref:Uncharacterized protein n=1 Tax=Streptosporangium saharense TaxID=1706840 RepID=A0A7W7QWB8_9ACTN|nr:hypothetical protein [Streptosporangium saharense]MBB4920991.1 hypothetical protein [Streptosporangium saharense]